MIAYIRMEQLVTRRAHDPEVEGSSPVYTTIKRPFSYEIGSELPALTPTPLQGFFLSGIFSYMGLSDVPLPEELFSQRGIVQFVKLILQIRSKNLREKLEKKTAL